MKRIKAVNGYTIYQYTKIDEKNGHTVGEYAIYFSSDVREFGTTYSDPEFEDVETVEICMELATGDNYANAYNALSSEYTAVSWSDVEKKAAELDKIASGSAPRKIDTNARYDKATARKIANECGALKTGDTITAGADSATVSDTVYYSDVFVECIDADAYIVYFDCEFIDTQGNYRNYKSYFDGGSVTIR